MNLATVIQELLAVSPTFGSWARSIENGVAATGNSKGRVLQSFYQSVPIALSTPASLTIDLIPGAVQAIVLGGNSKLRVRFDHSISFTQGAGFGFGRIYIFDDATQVALSASPTITTTAASHLPGSAMYESPVLPAAIHNVSLRWQMSDVALQASINPATQPLYLLVEEISA